MTEKTNVYATFTVSLTDTEWGYKAKKNGNAEMKVTVSRNAIENLDAGNLFQAILVSALAEYDNPTKTSEGEE